MTQRPSLAGELLARPGHWSVERALDLLRDGARDPDVRRSSEHGELMHWLRRDLPTPRADRATADGLYARVRQQGAGEPGFRYGADALRCAGYGLLAAAADPWAVERFLGIGCPWAVGLPAAGMRVIDLGCGSGVDVAIAARAAGPTGACVGVDLRDELLPAPDRWPPGTQFVAAPAECTGLDGRAADLIVANGLPPLMGLETAPPVLAEAKRLLLAGGELRAVVIVARLDTDPDSDRALIAARRTGKPLLFEIVAVLAEGSFEVFAHRLLPSPLAGHPDRDGVQAVLLRARPSQ